MKKEVAELEEESAKDGFWDDVQRSQKITQHMASLKNKIKSLCLFLYLVYTQ